MTIASRYFVERRWNWGLGEIEQLLELFIQGDAQKQGQFCGGVELPRFDGADGLAGNAHHRRQFSLRELLLGAGGFQIVE